MTCTICTAPLASPRQTLYCSRACATIANTIRRRESGRLTVEGGRVRTEADREWSREAIRRMRASGTYVSRRRCVRCNVPIVRENPGHCELCTRIVAKHRAARRRLAAAARGTRTRNVWGSGPCRRCGTQFTGLSNGQIAAYCSERCADADRRDTRRARQAGVKLTRGRRHAVFMRDGWICQLCTKPVDRSASVPDQLAATIDHIVPLARGGPHAESNWQTAHFGCNSRKGDRLTLSA